MHLTHKQLFKLVLLFLGVTLAVGALFSLYNLNRASIDNELVALNLLPQPEKLTELYFRDSTHLPRSATSNQVIRFAFVIHNLETTDYQYVYEVSVNVNGTRQIVDSGNALVKNNQYYVKIEQITLLNSAGIQEVVVELINKQQSIFFRTGQ